MSSVLLAAFEDEERLVDAIGKLREERVRIVDAFTPYPVEGLGAALGANPFPVRAAMLIGGLGTAGLCWFIEWFSAAIAFPFDSGSRPHNSWPVFPLFPFEFGVLMAGVFGLAALLWSTGLPGLNHPFFDARLSARASQDKFLLAVAMPETTDMAFRLRDRLAGLGADTVEEAEL
ncbi:MAG: DUF3341 domain-containing protein [Rhizobiaceae bacterium]